MPQVFYILFGSTFTVLTAIAVGRLLLERLRLRLYRGEEFLLAFFTGSACLSLIVFLITAAQLAQKGVFLAVGVLAIGLALKRGLHRSSGESLPPLPRFWKILFGIVFGAFLLVYFTNALAPERSPDGSTYHLGLVARYMREHGFRRLTTNMYANLSQGVEMLYLFAFAFGRNSAAALVHLAFLVALPLAMLTYAKRVGFAVAGAAAALLVFASPVVGMDGSTAYIDVALAAVLFAAFYLLQIWDQSRDNALLVPIGLLAGFGYAAKYTAIVAVPYALGFVGWKLVRARQPFVRPLLVISFCALLMMAPWLLKDSIWLGNPVSPFFNTVFPNPYIHVSMEQDYRDYFRHYEGFQSRWEIIPEVTIRGRSLNGSLGPVFLLAPLGLLSLRERAGRRLLLAALVFGSTYPLNIGTRFLIPVAPFVALAMGLAVMRARGMLALLVIVHALASWPSNIKLYSDVNAWKIEKRVPWKQALRIEPEVNWLTRVMPSYPIARMIEDSVPRGERVLALNQVAEAYTTRDVLVSYQAAFNQTLGDTLWVPVTEDWRPRLHLVFRFPVQKLRAVRVVQTKAGSTDIWSVNEFFVLNGTQELKRTPAWKVTSSPNPWEADLAFDRNLATRWRSWQALFPGMYLQTDFGGVEQVDAVRLECPLSPSDLSMELLGQTEAGQWVKLGGEPRQTVMDDPKGVRRAAVEALLERKVQWILINDSDYGAEDLKTHISEWGITFIGERNGARLYRLY